MLVPQTMFVPHTMLVPQTMLVPHTMLVPQTILVPHTMFWANAFSFEKTDVPHTMLVPQTMCCAQASAWPSMVVDVVPPEDSHQAPTGADVSIALASSAAP